MCSLICVWINGWVNNREAGDLRRNRTHYDVTVMRQGTIIDMTRSRHWKLFTTKCVFDCHVYVTAATGVRSSLTTKTLQWRHNEHDCVSNHQPRHCLLNRLFGRRSKKTSKLRATGLCVGNSPGTSEFPAQRASNAENVSIWWRHHVFSEIDEFSWSFGTLEASDVDQFLYIWHDLQNY